MPRDKHAAEPVSEKRSSSARPSRATRGERRALGRIKLTVLQQVPFYGAGRARRRRFIATLALCARASRRLTRFVIPDGGEARPSRGLARTIPLFSDAA